MDEKVVKDLIDRLIDLSFAEVFLPMLWENRNF